MFADIRHWNTAAPDTRKTARMSGQRRSFHHATPAAASPVRAAVAKMWAALNVMSGSLLPGPEHPLVQPGRPCRPPRVSAQDAAFLCQHQRGDEAHRPQQQPPPWRIEEPLTPAARSLVLAARTGPCAL